MALTLTPQQLEEVQKLASIYMTISDIALIIEVRPQDLRSEISNEESPVSIAYRRGKAMSKVTLRQQEMTLAQLGSPAGLEAVNKNLLDMEDDE